jgi:tetratricopeptide (TPR) repeat protein
VLCYWLLLFLAYQTKKEHAVTIGFFILLSFIPWLLSVGSSSLVAPQIHLVNALWKANYAKWSEREAEYLKVYTQAYPEDAEAFFTLGLIYKKNKDYQGAEFYYQKALEIKPELYHAHVNLGNVYCATKKLDQAIKEYNKAISLEPSRGTAHLNLSRTYLQKFMFAESEAEFMKARKLDKSLVDYFLTTYTEHPNRMIIDETLSRQVILDKAFSPPYEHRRLSVQLWDLLFRGMPYSYGWTAAVALIIGSLMLLKNNRFQYAKNCVTCGKTFCKKCQRITAQGSSCRQCMNILENREWLDPSLREDKLLEIKQYMRWQTAVTRFFTMAFPGAGLIWKGYLITGLICLFCFTFCLFKILTSAFLIQPAWDFIISFRYISPLIFLVLLVVLGSMLIKYTVGLISPNPYKALRMHTINRNTAI